MPAPLVALCCVDGRLCWEVESELERQAPGHQLVLQPRGDPYAYARDLSRLWAEGRPLVVVEGDVLPPEGAIPQLLECPEPWCAHELWTGERYDRYTLGLVKFSAELTERPELAARAWRDPRGEGGWRSILRSLDVAIAGALMAAQLEQHLHQPPAVHLRYASDPLLTSRLPGYRPRSWEAEGDPRRPG